MKEENIVKKVCKELGITQKELAEMLDIPENILKNIDARKDYQIVLENILKTKKLPQKVN